MLNPYLYPLSLLFLLTTNTQIISIFLARSRFFNGEGLSHFGGCRTQHFCSNKNALNSFAIPKCSSVLRLKSTLAVKNPDYFLLNLNNIY